MEARTTEKWVILHNDAQTMPHEKLYDHIKTVMVMKQNDKKCSSPTGRYPGDSIFHLS
jgi:hypothetical protein